MHVIVQGEEEPLRRVGAVEGRGLRASLTRQGRQWVGHEPRSCCSVGDPASGGGHARRLCSGQTSSISVPEPRAQRDRVRSTVGATRSGRTRMTDTREPCTLR